MSIPIQHGRDIDSHGATRTGGSAIPNSLTTQAKLSRNPEHLGLLRLKQRRYQKALGNLNQVLSLNPNLKEAWNNREKIQRIIAAKNK